MLQTIYQSTDKKSEVKPRSNSNIMTKKTNGHNFSDLDTKKRKISKKDKELAHKSVEHPRVADEIEKKVHDSETERLNDAVQGTHRVLFKTKAVFPWDLFPDELVVDENKVSFIFNSFFEKRVHSIFVKDISDVITNVSVFFASVDICDLGFKENYVSITFLRKDEATRARRIIQGLVVAYKREIDINHVPLPELTQKLEELGSVEN